MTKEKFGDLYKEDTSENITDNNNSKMRMDPLPCKTRHYLNNSSKLLDTVYLVIFYNFILKFSFFLKV